MTSDTRLRPWLHRDAGRLIGRGHPAGDFLQAHDWRVVEERIGFLRLDVHLPDHVRNPRGQLFGGFTPAYVDLVALFTVRAGTERGLARPVRTQPVMHNATSERSDLVGSCRKAVRASRIGSTP